MILASASPRRADLLTDAGIEFEIAASSIDETPRDNEPAAEYVLRVARDKATAIRKQYLDGRPILAADTVVVAGGRLLGKPADRAEARVMLNLLSGSVHEVLTGVVLMYDNREAAEVATTRVRFVPMTEADINWYIETGEADEKAGAYAIQGRASRYVDWIEGSWSNVVGLPVATVYRLLRDAHVLC